MGFVKSGLLTFVSVARSVHTEQHTVTFCHTGSKGKGCDTHQLDILAFLTETTIDSNAFEKDARSSTTVMLFEYKYSANCS